MGMAEKKMEDQICPTDHSLRAPNLEEKDLNYPTSKSYYLLDCLVNFTNCLQTVKGKKILEHQVKQK